MSVSPSASADLAPPSTRMACSPPPTWARPPGASRFNCRSCSFTSTAVKPSACRRAGIQLDANLPIEAADALHLRDALHTHQPFRDGVVDRPAQLLRRHVGGGDRIDRERSAVIVLALHLRFENALRQIGAYSRDGVANVGDRPIDRAYRC